MHMVEDCSFCMNEMSTGSQDSLEEFVTTCILHTFSSFPMMKSCSLLILLM